MKPLVSVIVPCRNEFPSVVHTFHSLMHCAETDGIADSIEIILVDNCSTDTHPEKPGVKGTSSHLMPRGAYFNKILRVLYDPIAGNHSARNKGAAIAYGKYLFFSDAHMAYRPGYFKRMIRAVDESGGMAHGALQFMGAYPPRDDSMGFGYSIKLGEEIKGTWNNYKVADDWFYVPAQGHWGVAVRRDQFLKFGGYPKVHRTYGGGEFYTDMKWWLFGSCVVADPHAVGYHLASERGYSYQHNDYKENVLGISYALGMDDWRERAYINWLRHTDKPTMDAIMERNEKEYAKERLFVEKHRKMTFNELIVKRPWNELNKKRHGNSNSGLTIFHDTWLPLLSGEAKKAYENAKYQKGLEEFINSQLSEFVYKR